MLRKISFCTVIVFILVPFLLSAPSTSADTGPKPTATIQVFYEGNPVSDSMFSARMFVCYKEDQDPLIEQSRINTIKDGTPEQLRFVQYDVERGCYWEPAYFAWGGDCKRSSCFFHYMLPEEFKLAAYIPSLNRVFLTNAVYRTNFNANFRVELHANGEGSIRESTPFLFTDGSGYFLRNLLITLIIELLISFFLFRKLSLPLKMLWVIAAGNIITLSVIWFVLTSFVNAGMFNIIFEIFAFLVEAVILYLVFRKRIKLGTAFMISATTNVASWVVGGFVEFFIVGGALHMLF